MSRLANLSVHTTLASGPPLTVGFVTTEAKPILVRGVGPGMHDVFPQFFSTADVFADPLLELYNASNTRIDQNDNWNASLLPFFDQAGAHRFNPGSKDAALLVTLPPGIYTAQLSGVGGTTGDGVVEVYDVP